MKHYGEEDLILLFYGESSESEAIERHLGECERCRAEYEALKVTFAAVDAVEVPDRNEAYPREVWARLQAEIGRREATGWRVWLAPRRLVPVAAVAILVMAAFLAGQWRGTRVTVDTLTESIPGEVRERIVLAALGGHLERSHRLLVELAHAEGNGDVDLSDHRAMARSLMNLNRVYRRTAEKGGDPFVADVLQDLERVLLEVANGPDSIVAADLVELQDRIGRRGLLVKVRVLGERAREEVRAVPAAPLRDRV